MSRLPLSVLLLALLMGCNSTPEKPPKTWAEIRAEQVSEFMLHLNNESRTERHRDGLIEIGRKSKADRDYVLSECDRAYSNSLERGGTGTGVLRAPGRRRVMEVLHKLKDTLAGRKLLKQGLDDVEEVRIASAIALADHGDGQAIPVLLQTVLKEGVPADARQSGLQALRRLAKPARRELFLSKMRPDTIEVLTPVALKTFPDKREKLLKALREVAGGHQNPFARVFALQVLVEEKDNEAARELAKRALDSGIDELRPTALKVLGAAGGARAAAELEAVLRDDPPNPKPAVEGLFNAGTRGALDRAVGLFEDVDLQPRTRAAIARGFLGRMAEPGAPRVYKTDAARERALRALHAALEEDGLIVAASVEAVGKIGRGDSDVEPLLVLLEDPSAEIGPLVVTALGQLGGEAAANKLVELLSGDPQLGKQAADALGAFKSAKVIPMHDLIDLLGADEVDVRKLSLRALMSLFKTKDRLGYNPEADEESRDRAMKRWRKLWTSRQKKD